MAEVDRDVAQRKLLSAWTFITPVNLSYEDYKKQYKMEYNGIKQALPKNVQILTLEPWKATSFLLRLEHIFEKDEDVNLSKPVTVDVQNLFESFSIKSIRETTLGANQWLSENERLQWNLGTPLEEYVQKPYRRGYWDNDRVQLRTYLNRQSSEESREQLSNAIPKDSDSFEEIHLKRTTEYDIFEEKESENVKSENVKSEAGTVITLQPMQIRTFVIEITKK